MSLGSDSRRRGHLSKPEGGWRARPADVWGQRKSKCKSLVAGALPACLRTGQEFGVVRIGRIGEAEDKR